MTNALYPGAITQGQPLQFLSSGDGIYYTGTGTVTVTANSTTITFSASQSSVLGTNIFIKTSTGQIFGFSSGSGTSWTADRAASYNETAVSFKYVEPVKQGYYLAGSSIVQPVGGIYQASPPAALDGGLTTLETDTYGNLLVNTGVTLVAHAKTTVSVGSTITLIFDGSAQKLSSLEIINTDTVNYVRYQVTDAAATDDNNCDVLQPFALGSIANRYKWTANDIPKVRIFGITNSVTTPTVNVLVRYST